MEPEFDVVVVGAGVVGLAIGRALALDAGRLALHRDRIGERSDVRRCEREDEQRDHAAPL